MSNDLNKDLLINFLHKSKSINIIPLLVPRKPSRALRAKITRHHPIVQQIHNWLVLHASRCLVLINWSTQTYRVIHQLIKRTVFNNLDLQCTYRLIWSPTLPINAIQRLFDSKTTVFKHRSGNHGWTVFTNLPKDYIVTGDRGRVCIACVLG